MALDAALDFFQCVRVTLVPVAIVAVIAKIVATRVRKKVI